MALNTGIYSALYDKVGQRLAKEGLSMPISKEALRIASEMPPGVFDAAVVAQADNYTFYQVAHICLLCTLPEEEDYAIWRDYFETMPPSQFRTQALRFVLNRCAACNRGAKIVNGEEYIET
jgi:hypothetical protein